MPATEPKLPEGTNFLQTDFHIDTDLIQFEEGIPQHFIPAKRRVLRLYMPQEVEPIVLMDVRQLVLGRGSAGNKLDLSLRYGSMLGVSREHAEITYANNYYLLTDLGSSNGTYLNGRKLVPFKTYILESNDQIRLGHFVIVASFV